MKILVLLLARLGDIYMAWPTLRALKRMYPHAQLDVIVREKFAPALDGVDVVDRIHKLPVRDILSSLVLDAHDDQFAIQKLSEFADKIAAEKYDRIINLSFSPFSSYLTHALQGDGTQVCGYSRTDDGFLALPDDASAYFYAQVGVGRQNRHHLADIFAAIAQVDLIESDWRAPTGERVTHLPEKYIAVHIGASQVEKSLDASQWAVVLDSVASSIDMDFVLIGSKEEAEKSHQILADVKKARVLNEVGRTSLSQVFQAIHRARCLIGGDSAPIHIASLTKTKTINLSFSNVNHWETGPRSPESSILLYDAAMDVDPRKVADQILSALLSPSMVVTSPRYDDFQWSLIKAIYMQEEFPTLEAEHVVMAFVELKAINDSMIEWLEKRDKLANFKELIVSGDEMISTIAKVVPQVAPLVAWYRTEKVRIGPGTQESILEKTIGVHKLLKGVLDLYIPDSKSVEFNGSVGEIL